MRGFKIITNAHTEYTVRLSSEAAAIISTNALTDYTIFWFDTRKKEYVPIVEARDGIRTVVSHGLVVPLSLHKKD